MSADDFTRTFHTMAEWMQKDADQRDQKPKPARVPTFQPLAAAAVPGAQEDANGLLIAQAPELLRVARLALEELEWFPAIRHTQALRDDLRRVIAAATSASDHPTTEHPGA